MENYSIPHELTRLAKSFMCVKAHKPSDSEQLVKAVKQLIEDCETAAKEFDIFTKDGSGDSKVLANKYDRISWGFDEINSLAGDNYDAKIGFILADSVVDFLEFKDPKKIVLETLAALHISLLNDSNNEFNTYIDQKDMAKFASINFNELTLDKDAIDAFMSSFKLDGGCIYTETLKTIELTKSLLHWPVKFIE